MPDPIAPIPPIATMQRPLSEKAQELKAKHYADYAQALEERDRALERIAVSDEACAKASHRIAGLAEENAFLKRRIEELETDYKSRVMTYQLERDQAVAKFAKLEGLMISVQAQLRAHEIPNAPVVQVAPDAEAPEFKEPTHYKQVGARIPDPLEPPMHKDIIARIKV